MSVWVWAPPEMDPERRISEQLIYLGGDPGGEMGEWDREGEEGRRGCTVGAAGTQSCGGTINTLQRCPRIPLQQEERWAAVVIPQLSSVTA